MDMSKLYMERTIIASSPRDWNWFTTHEHRRKHENENRAKYEHEKWRKENKTMAPNSFYCKHASFCLLVCFLLVRSLSCVSLFNKNSYYVSLVTIQACNRALPLLPDVLSETAVAKDVTANSAGTRRCFLPTTKWA